MWEQILNFIGTVLVAVLAFFLGLKSKKVDVDIQKERELNIILSNLISAWQHLYKLSELQQFIEDESDALIFPKQYLPFIALKTGVLDDESFDNLDGSIEMLKQYDPIAYYNLNGISKKFEYIRLNYILPFLQSNQKENSSFKKLNRSFIDKILNDLEEYLRYTSKLISKNNFEQIQNLIDRNAKNNFEERIRDFNWNYYELMTSIMPKHIERPTYDEFINLINTPEIQSQIQAEFDLMANKGLGNLITLIIENPSLSLEQIRDLNNI